MNDQSDALEEILPAIQRAARHIALEWPNVVEEDDIAQDIAVRLLRDSSAADVRDMDPGMRSRVLFRIAQQIASGEQVDFEHYTGQYRYSTDEVRSYLENGAMDPNAERTRFDAGRLDVCQALAEASPGDREILARRYASRELLPAAERMLAVRALDRLTLWLNRGFRGRAGEHEGPGSRRAMSNAQAASITANQY